MIIGVFESAAMAPYVTDRLLPGPEVTSDEALLEYIREDASTTYHPTSTCRIGSVVDENLKVLGVSGLRVVDASVMPFVVSGNTNAPTIMIAEKAADLIRAGG